MRPIRRYLTSSFVSLVVASMLLVPSSGPTAALAQDVCTADVGIVNGGFEDPTVEPFRAVTNPTIAGWAAAGFVRLLGPDASNASQRVALGDGETTSGSVSQALAGVPAGSTVTFTIISQGSGTIALGGESQAVSGSTAVSFDVPDPAPASLDLTLSSQGWGIDQISGSYVVPCAPPDPVTRDDCKDGGWARYGFRNQGQCNHVVNTGQDSRP